jgi:hypothetical protein
MRLIDMKIIKPKAPKKKVYLKGYLPMYLLYKLLRPDPKNSNAVLSGPAQSLPF